MEAARLKGETRGLALKVHLQSKHTAFIQIAYLFGEALGKLVALREEIKCPPTHLCHLPSHPDDTTSGCTRLNQPGLVGLPAKHPGNNKDTG